MNEIMNKLQPIFEGIIGRGEAAGALPAEDLTVAEYVTVFMPYTTSQEVNQMLRIINPKAKLSGKGITTESKFAIVIDYITTDLEKQEDEEMAKQEEAKKQAAEQQRRIAKCVAYINKRAGFELVDATAPVHVLKDLVAKYKAAPTIIPMTQEKLQAEMVKQHQQGFEEAASKINVPEPSVVENEPAVDTAVLEKQLAELEIKKQQALGKNPAIMLQVVDQYRAVEAKLHELKGGDVNQLIKDKYNGFRTAAGAGFKKAGDVTYEYGHKGVSAGAGVLNNVFDTAINVTKDLVNVVDRTGKSVIGVTESVGHAGVDLAANALYATGDFIDGKNK
jgi:hypothetical protein